MRALLAALLALCILAAPATASAQPLIGIGEQHPQIFSDPAFAQLGIRDVRFVAAYDALNHQWQREELDRFMTLARANGIRVLLGFGHSRLPQKAHTPPTVASFERQVVRFRARYPWVKDFLTWNEANHCSQPTCRKPELAAKYYLALRKHCAGCRIVAADVLDGSNMVEWAKRFQKAVGGRRVIWGLHNYIDANRFRTRGTKGLLRAVKGDIWFTETGGIVKRTNKSPVKLPESTRHAAKVTNYVFKLAGLSSRIKRVYFYHWTAPQPGGTWDSAFVNIRGQTRMAYDVLHTWLVRHGVAH